MKTKATRAEDFQSSGKYQRQWHLIDASEQPLGRLAARIAVLLRGKHRPYFSPHVDCGDYVVVINAAAVKLTGDKLRQKVYYRHSGFVGGIKSETAGFRLTKKPTSLIYDAVKRMMPRNALNRHSFRKLFVYAGVDHPHQANKPAALIIEKVARHQKSQNL